MKPPMTFEEALAAVQRWAGSWSTAMNSDSKRTFAQELTVYPADQVEAALHKARADWEQAKHPPLSFVLARIPQAAPPPIEVRPVDYSVNLIRLCVHDHTPDSVWSDMTADEREKHARAVMRTATGAGKQEEFAASPEARAWFAKLGCSHVLPQPVQHTLAEPDPFADEVAV